MIMTNEFGGSIETATRRQWGAIADLAGEYILADRLRQGTISLEDARGWLDDVELHGMEEFWAKVR